jgi:hypothetical protein
MVTEQEEFRLKLDYLKDGILEYEPRVRELAARLGSDVDIESAVRTGVGNAYFNVLFNVCNLPRAENFQTDADRLLGRYDFLDRSLLDEAIKASLGGLESKRLFEIKLEGLLVNRKH